MNLREKFECVTDLSQLGIRYPFLSKEIARLISHVISTSDTLTSHEIQLGIYEGKLECVKAFRERTNLTSLIECKRVCEKYFADNGLQFKQYS